MRITPPQTIGPFFAIGLPWPRRSELVVPPGSDALEITGRVSDGADAPVDDALIEIWQPDRKGRFPSQREDASPGRGTFTGLGRGATDSDGCFHFVTCKPGRVPAPDGRLQAPHLDVALFSRGLLVRLVTRMYFPDERTANADDPVLSSIGPERSGTLIAHADDAGLRFDIRLQGDRETVFFAL